MSIEEAPAELAAVIKQFWPEHEWDNAANISKLESGWNAFAILDTTDDTHPCGSPVGYYEGVPVSAERSVGYFQINTCNYPGWEWARFYNAWHNAGTAHHLWSQRGWQPWFFSARRLGLIS
jgi:hypothetical protein